MNNLYSTTMTLALPKKDLQFTNEMKLQNLNFISIPVNSPTDYILEVDMEYNDKLHHLH